MSKEQIEEMAEVLRHSCENECFKNKDGFADCEACEACLLYDAGYRKQSEGEWKLGKSGCMYFCSSCGYSAFPREEEEWNFCPRCGTKMKGGAE